MGFIHSPESRDGILCDAIWWFKGFRAAQPNDNMSSDPTSNLADQLSGVRSDLNRMALGKVRLIGANYHQQAIAIRECEFEVIYDAFQEWADGEDIKNAFDTLKRILAEFRAEQRDVRLGDVVPF